MPLSLSVQAVQPDFIAGETIYACVELENTGAEPVSLPHPGQRDCAPNVLLRRPDEAAFSGFRSGSSRPLGTLELKPGERWTDPVEFPRGACRQAGEYLVSAVLEFEGRLLLANESSFHFVPFTPGSLHVSVWGDPPAHAFLTWVQQSPTGAHFVQDWIEERSGNDATLFRTGTKRILPVHPQSAEPWIAAARQHPERLVTWRFWRTGNTVYGHGPSLTVPPKLDLPEGTGPLLGPPLEDEQHQVDLFYSRAAGPDTPELLAVRFADPYVHSGAEPRVLGTETIPFVPDCWALACDSSASRHVVCSRVEGRRMLLGWATVSAEGQLGLFRVRIVPGLLPSIPLRNGGLAIEPLKDGSLRVATVCLSATDPKTAHLVEARLEDAGAHPVAIHVVHLADEPVAARASFGQVQYAVWPKGGGVKTFSPSGLPVRELALETGSPPILFSLADASYIVETSHSGPEIIAL